MDGKVVILKSEEKYGLIKCSLNNEIYWFSTVGTESLNIDDNVTFDIIEDSRFLQATNIKAQ